ncbi:hypothetical protein LZ32DRAFT_648152 [Colletotrichum eremochloae]|nr:hypothetical protein LZ32DRAFT_648152 [Colletotrichum eremochloae]
MVRPLSTSQATSALISQRADATAWLPRVVGQATLPHRRFCFGTLLVGPAPGTEFNGPLAMREMGFIGFYFVRQPQHSTRRAERPSSPPILAFRPTRSTTLGGDAEALIQVVSIVMLGKHGTRLAIKTDPKRTLAQENIGHEIAAAWQATRSVEAGQGECFSCDTLSLSPRKWQ